MRFCIGSSRREPGPEAGGEREVSSLREAKAAGVTSQVVAAEELITNSG